MKNCGWLVLLALTSFMSNMVLQAQVARNDSKNVSDIYRLALEADQALGENRLDDAQALYRQASEGLRMFPVARSYLADEQFRIDHQQVIAGLRQLEENQVVLTHRILVLYIGRTGTT